VVRWRGVSEKAPPIESPAGEALHETGQGPPTFVGSAGPDWNVRPAQLGPPDNVNETQLQWLIVPGPPLSCYLAFIFPRQDPSPLEFYHAHPNAWSLHVVLAGEGYQTVEGVRHEVGHGSVLYHGPGVRHSLAPKPNQPLVHVAVQYPHVGYEAGQWRIAPEAGTAHAFQDLAAFVKQFGAASGEDVARAIRDEKIWQSERWRAFVTERKPSPR
jgi:mannose-6-phosphate isomerase-like protein (cupin superfamily)